MPDTDLFKRIGDEAERISVELKRRKRPSVVRVLAEYAFLIGCFAIIGVVFGVETFAIILAAYITACKVIDFIQR